MERLAGLNPFDKMPPGSFVKRWIKRFHERRKIKEIHQRETRLAEELKIAEDIEAVCQNCDTSLTGPFCHSCGQKDGELQRPFWTFFRETVDNFFAADSRLVKSLFTLIFYPGGLTRSYMSGMRARYLTPFKLYFVISISFFVIVTLSQVAIIDIRLFPIEKQVSSQAMPETEMLEQGGEAMQDSELRDVPSALADTLVEGAKQQAGCGDYTCMPFAEIGSYRIGVAMFAPITAEKRITISQEELQSYMNLQPKNKESENFFSAIEKGLVKGFESPTVFNDLFNKWIPRTLFVLMPVFALILRMFHWRKDSYYVSQLVFSLHFHSFLFVLLLAEMVIIPLWGHVMGMEVFWWAASLYLIIALKVAMKQGIIRAFLKAGFIWVIYFILLCVAIFFAVYQGLMEL